jgi:hypothetical protein
MSDRPTSPAADLLAWYSAMGVDVAVEEVAANRLAPRPAAPPPTAGPGNTVTSLPGRKPLPAAPALPRATVAPGVGAPPAEVERAARSAAGAAISA